MSTISVARVYLRIWCKSRQCVGTIHRPIPLLANRSELVVYLSVPDRWENTRVDQAERVPFTGKLSLEVPPKPPLRLFLKRSDLSFNVAPRVVLVPLRPLRDVVLPAAGTNERATGESTVVASTSSVAVKVLCAICHCTGPLANEC
jgi:hypothetical protein